MKKISLLTISLLLSILSFAEELNYKWIAGQSYHFIAEVNDDVKTSMMGMNMNEKFKTSTDFYLSINSVDENGLASGILYLINFNVQDSKGNVLASLSDIPNKAIVSDVTVDRKGNFTFLKKVFLVTSVSGNVLAYGKVDENSVSAGGQAGNMKVDAYAEFDPKTGKLKAGYRVQEIKNTTQVEVKMTENTDIVDVLPYDFLQLLALPEGNVNTNDEVSATAGMYTMNVKVTSMENNIAQLNHTMSTDKNADMFDGAASAKTGDGQSQFDMKMDTDLEGDDMDLDFDSDDMNMDFDSDDMDMDMDDMGMDLPNNMGGLTKEDKAAVETSKSMAPDMTCDINTNFDYVAGMFKTVGGTVNTNLNVMGMKINVVSNIVMYLKP